MTTNDIDLDAIEARVAKLESFADQEATGLRGPAYTTAVALAANLSAADVPALVAEVRRLRAELAERQGGSDTYLIWSHHHRMWFAPSGCGYRTNVNDAGRYTLADTKKWLGRGCGCCEVPEVPVPAAQVTQAGDVELREAIRTATTAAIGAGDVNQYYAGGEVTR